MEPTHDANLQSHIHQKAMIPPYTHIPLPNASTHIRLIKLYPAVAFGQGTSASTNSQIKCNMSVASIDALPPFAVLSYAWGTSDATEPLYIDQHDEDDSGLVPDSPLSAIYITPSLMSGLVQITKSESSPEPLLLWVNQICINSRTRWRRMSKCR